MKVHDLILGTLDDLGSSEFKRFLWNLNLPVVDGCAPIPKSRLENADRQDTVSKMIESYGDKMAVNVTVEILKRIGNNRAAAKLKEEFAGGSTSTNNSSPAPSTSTSSSSSSSSSVVTPAAGSSVCAQGKSVIVAPNISGTSSGVSINMNINTQ